MSEQSLVLLTNAEANGIADALLAGCRALTAAEGETDGPHSLEYASLYNTFTCLRDAMLLLEGAINRYAPADEPPTITTST